MVYYEPYTGFMHRYFAPVYYIAIGHGMKECILLLDNILLPSNTITAPFITMH